MLYDYIGKNYDMTRHSDPYICQRLLLHLKPDKSEKYLDIACGSGNYTLFLRHSGFNVYGVDISENMLQIARQKDNSIDWIQGDVKMLPFSNGIFSGATCILGIHHFSDVQKVFKEVSRVMLKGRFVVFTASAEQMEGYWLNEYFPKSMLKSIRQMPREDELKEYFYNAHFNKVVIERYEIRNDCKTSFFTAVKIDRQFTLTLRFVMVSPLLPH